MSEEAFNLPQRPIYVGMTDCANRTGDAQIVKEPCSCPEGFKWVALVPCKYFGQTRAMARCRMFCQEYKPRQNERQEQCQLK